MGCFLYLWVLVDMSHWMDLFCLFAEEISFRDVPALQRASAGLPELEPCYLSQNKGRVKINNFELIVIKELTLSLSNFQSYILETP